MTSRRRKSDRCSRQGPSRRLPDQPVDNRRKRPQPQLPTRTRNPDGDPMDFHAAAQQAIHDIQGADPDSDTVRAGLQLAVHAWQTCHPHPATATGWAMFGTALGAAIDELDPPPQPVVVCIDDPQPPDTAQLRHHTAALATAIAQRLETAAGDPHHHRHRRWAWAAAAARLRTASYDLTTW